jgi:hypothetical protein
MSNDEMDVRAALQARYSGSRATASSGASCSLAARRARERSALAPSDGRVRRGRGPTVQLNVGIAPELKERLVEACRDHRMTIVELVERGIEKALAELERSR